MPGRQLLRLPSTGTGPPDRRLDMLEQGTAQAFSDVERGFDTGGKWTLRRSAANCAAQAWDFVLANPTAAAFTVLIPDATSCALAELIVKNDSASTNTITVRAAVGTIDGSTSQSIATARGSLWLKSDGREWKVIAGSSGSAGLVIQYGTDANTTALPNRLVYMPALTAARSVFFPASPTDGMWLRLLVSNAQTFTVTADGNGKNIDDRFGSVTATYVVSNDGTLLEFVYLATPGTWMIL